MSNYTFVIRKDGEDILDGEWFIDEFEKPLLEWLQHRILVKSTIRTDNMRANTDPKDQARTYFSCDATLTVCGAGAKIIP